MAKDKLQIVPIGGCGEFGMNITLYHFKGTNLVVDCGVMFADDNRPGIDSIIPDCSEVFEKYGEPDAYLITHGHEDHLGAVPFIVPRYPAPIYTPNWSRALLNEKAEWFDEINSLKINAVKRGDSLKIKSFAIDWLHVTHSIPNCCSLYIKCDAAKVIHTGDFKWDEDCTFEEPPDSKGFQSAGKQGVDLILSDSTNANSKGHCPSEDSVHKPLKEAIAGASKSIFFTTFSSNLWRLITIIRIGHELGKKIVLSGSGIERTLRIASKLGLDNFPKDHLMNEDEARSKSPGDLIYLVTGCQGEWASSLARISRREHRSISLSEGDSVIFSARIIPGCEKRVFNLMSILKGLGANIIDNRSNPGIHVSGHGFQSDLEKLYQATQPKNVIAVHGTNIQLHGNAALARKALKNLENAPIISNGDVIHYGDDKLEIQESAFEPRVLFVDRGSNQQLPFDVLRRRFKVGELGLCILQGAFNIKKQAWLEDPSVTHIGIAVPSDNNYQPESEVRTAISKALKSGTNADEDLKEVARLAFRRYLESFINKKVVVIPTINFL